jgi:hypothetical protein
MEASRLDRVEDLGDPQFAEVLRIVESVEPPRMDLMDVRDEEKLHGGTMRTPPVISPEERSAGGVVGIDRSAKELRGSGSRSPGCEFEAGWLICVERSRLRTGEWPPGLRE